MKKLNDSQKIKYVFELNKLDKVTQYQRGKGKRFIIELYEEAIYEHDSALIRFEKEEITFDEADNIQNNVIKFIKLLKSLNSKHKLLDTLID